MVKFIFTDIAIIFVSFSMSKNGKKRPILIIEQQDSKLKAYAITSQFNNKSKFIQQKYFEIIDWQEANLDKVSWIDTITLHHIEYEDDKIEKIGKLSNRDFARFVEFINKG